MPRSHRQRSHLIDVMNMYMRPRVLNQRAGGSLVEVESGIKPEHIIMLTEGRHSAMIDLQHSICRSAKHEYYVVATDGSGGCSDAFDEGQVGVI